jgi:hypothetical protein
VKFAIHANVDRVQNCGRMSQRSEGASPEIRKASRARAPDSPSPGEYMGERNARERQHRKCWPVRSETMDGESVAVRTARPSENRLTVRRVKLFAAFAVLDGVLHVYHVRDGHDVAEMISRLWSAVKWRAPYDYSHYAGCLSKARQSDVGTAG